jgi:argonaute-like protein implicated in RNA metabolism and viral defense
VVYDNTYLRELNNSDFDQIAKQYSNLGDRILAAAELYLNEIKYLAKNKSADVILCVISENFFEHITKAAIETDLPEEVKENTVTDEDDEIEELEENFRRYLKAKAMQHQIPIQIVRDRIANPTPEMQDEATIAWNFFTALYYKASGTPWALIRKDMSETTCYAGLSFYKSRDKKTTQTSIAQIFNEVGKGVILRGEEIKKQKDDRSPHLTGEQAYKLLYDSLKEYHEAIRQMPKRLVLHKTSNFNDAEVDGFKSAAKAFHIYQVDLITILSSDIRLYREYQYPPLRGTHIALTDKQHVLYTRGSVPYYETYTGMYIPRAIEVRLFEYDESPNRICDEILALTKMNWNNTQFDRRLPITIECARNVGDILKYLGNDDNMQLKYSFYM